MCVCVCRLVNGCLAFVSPLVFVVNQFIILFIAVAVVVVMLYSFVNVNETVIRWGKELRRR